MIPLVYDLEDGIRLCFDFENGMSINVDMDDHTADEFIKIIRNKLNARL